MNAIAPLDGRAPDDPQAAYLRQLVAAAVRGDDLAQAEVHRRYAGLVHGILLCRVPSSDVEDLLQDVFLRVLERLDQLREPETLGAWIAAIARNVAHDFHRRRPRSEPLPEDLPESAPPTPEAREVLDAIRSLPEAYRESLALRLVQGMTGPEIAERLGLTPGSVRVNLHRGMRRLRERLGAPGSERRAT